MAPVTVSLFVSIRGIRGFLRKKVPGTKFMDKNLSNGVSRRGNAGMPDTKFPGY
jgi:hypothetical protein